MSSSPGIRPQVERILRDLQDEDEDICTYAAMNVLRLKEIKPDEIRELTPHLRDATSHESISVRFFAKKALNAVRHQMAKFPEFRTELESIRAETMGTSWLDLLSHLEEAETEKKLVVLDLLRDVPDVSLASATIEFMSRETDPFVLAEAVRVCGMVGEEHHLAHLQPYLAHPDSRVRSNAVEALDEIGGKSVMAQIVPLLDDEDNRVRATVAKLLAKYGEHNVLYALRDMLRSVELWMRESATYALGFVPFREAEDLLIEALLDVNPEVQAKAIASMKTLRSRRSREVLETVVRQADAKLGELAAAALAAIAKDPQDYQYFDEANKNSENPLAAKARELREARRSQSEIPNPAARPPEGDEPSLDEASLEEEKSGFTLEKSLAFLGRFKAKREEEKFQHDLREERELLKGEIHQKKAELGKQILEVYRGGDFQSDQMRDLNNDIKKIQYLIDIKENQRKEIAEESQRSSFLDFVRESLLRFSREKQVENRVSTLHLSLQRKYAEICDCVMADYDAESVEMMQFKELPRELSRLEKRLFEIAQVIGDDPGTAERPPTLAE